MALILLDDNRIFEVNPAFCELLGWGRGEVVGRTSGELDIFVEPAQRRELVETVLRKGGALSRDVQLRALSAALATATRFSEHPVAIEIEQDGRFVSVRFLGRGKSLPAGLVSRFFEPLSISEADTAAGDIGLNPAIARGIARIFGGDATIRNTPGPGIELGLRLLPELPLAKAGQDPG